MNGEEQQQQESVPTGGEQKSQQSSGGGKKNLIAAIIIAVVVLALGIWLLTSAPVPEPVFEEDFTGEEAISPYDEGWEAGEDYDFEYYDEDGDLDDLEGFDDIEGDFDDFDF